MTGRLKVPIWVMIALLLSINRAIAQETRLLPPVPVGASPLPSPEPPPLTAEQRTLIEKSVQTELSESRAVGDRIEEKVNRTFGWTISLLNLLITVLIAIPILSGLAAFYLRRSVLDRMLYEIRQEMESVKEQIKAEAARDLKNQLEAFKKDLKRSKATFTTQLQTLSSSAQAEKERIFQELARITPSMIQEEFVAPEIQKQIQILSKQLELLKYVNPQLMLTAEEYLNQGQALTFDRQYSEALEAFEKAIELQPELAEAWFGKAKALRRAERYDEAFLAIEQAMHLTAEDVSQHYRCWHEKADVLRNLERYEEALVAYEKAIALNPNSGDTWKRHGYTLTKLGRYSEALFSLEKGKELHPTLGGSYYTFAYYHAVQGQVDLALEHLKQAIALHPRFKDDLTTDSDFEILWQDDRLKQLLKEIV
jgi:tetratricopeptide (TPR) repeat protein